MKRLNRLENFLFMLGGVLLLVGAAIRLFTLQWSLYLYGVGAMLFCLMQVRQEYLGNDFILKRLRRQQLFACVCFLLAAVCMSMQTYHYGLAVSNEWLIPLVVGCILELYTSFRIPQELSKSKKS